MKLVGLSVGLLLFVANAFAIEPRSYAQRIFSPAYMSDSQPIQIKNGSELKTISLSNSLGGKQLKTEDRRSIVLLEDLEQIEADLSEPLVQKIKKATPGGLQKFYVFANFVHSNPRNTDVNEFFIAVIPKSAKVEKVFLQTEWFGGGAGAHNQVRMILNKPIVLIPQVSDESPIELKVADIIYSLQAVRVEGGDQNWDPLKGTMGEFANALQIYSTTSLARMQIPTSVVENNEILGLTDEQRKLIFEKALYTSNLYQEAGIYNTVFNSGVTHTLIALVAGIPRIDVYHFNPYSVLDMVRKAHKGTIRSAGTMNAEFPKLVGRVMTWQRLKEAPAYGKVEPLLPIISTPTFDNVVRDIALFVAEKKINYSEVKSIVAGIRAGKTLGEIDKTAEGKKFIDHVATLWSKEFPGKNLKVFFESVDGLKSQL